MMFENQKLQRVLWSNYKTTKFNHILGTIGNFILKKFDKS